MWPAKWAEIAVLLPPLCAGGLHMLISDTEPEAEEWLKMRAWSLAFRWRSRSCVATSGAARCSSAFRTCRWVVVCSTRSRLCKQCVCIDLWSCGDCSGGTSSSYVYGWMVSAAEPAQGGAADYVYAYSSLSSHTLKCTHFQGAGHKH